MPDIVITEFMDAAAAAGLERSWTVVHDTTLADDPERLRAAAADARALIVRNRTQVGGELLAACGRLEVVGRLGVGLDNIDVEACRARGIAVCPATGANDLAVAEYVIASVLMLLRGAYQSSAEVAAGDWPRERLIGREAAGKRLGLVGFGAIARETAQRAAALGMEVGASDPYVTAADPAWRAVRRLDLDELLAWSDAVSLHVPLTSTTRHLIDATALGRCRADAVLVNAARGGVLDEEALADALRAGRLAGAALDVFETEPLRGKQAARFAGLANVLLTPHIAGVTAESNVRVSAVTAENVRRVLAATPT